MNESLFFFHIFLVIGFALAALRLGKGALIALIALQGILANLFVVKQMTFFGLFVTCSDVFAVGCMLSLNLLQEYFGKKSAKEASLISFLLLVFFVAMSQIHLQYTPAPVDETHGAFLQIFSATPRIVFASVATFALVQQIDVRLFALLRGPLPLRVMISLVCSQVLDTALFSFLGLYGLVASIGSVIVLSLCIKGLVIALSSPFTAFAKRVVKDVPV